MFKVEFFVDDKTKIEFLRALDGIAIDLKVVPVRNVVKQNGQLKSTAAGTTTEAILKYANDHKTKLIAPKQIEEALHAGGFSPKGVNTAIKNAIKAKVLKRKSRGQYVIV